MKASRFAWAAMLAVSVADFASAASSNLVVNPHFNRDLAAWTAWDPGNSTTAIYSATDMDGAADSGSALVSAVAPNNFIITALRSSCFPVVAGRFYRWSTKLFIPGTQSGAGVVQPGFRFSTDPACATLMAPTYSVTNTSVVNTTVTLHAEGPAPAGAVAGQLWLMPIKTGGSAPFSAYFDDVEVVELGCNGLESDTTLCLQGGRFAVTASWQSGTASGTGRAVQLTPDTGYFWFFNASNVELLIKVLDACVVPFQHFWSFSAGLTNVQVDLTVVDTKNGTTKVYHNPLNTDYPPKLDTSAFATCP